MRLLRSNTLQLSLFPTLKFLLPSVFIQQKCLLSPAHKWNAPFDFVQDRKCAFMNLLEVESNAEEQTVLIAHILAYLRPKLAPNIPRSFHECWCGLSCFFFHKVKFKGATVTTRMLLLMPTVLWQWSAVSSISPLGSVCRKYGSRVWAYPSQDCIWLACAPFVYSRDSRRL